MNGNRFLYLLLILCFWAVRLSSQTLVCNDLVYVSLDEDCATTLTEDMILEGVCNCPLGTTVEIDRVPPYGNGPWSSPDLTAADIGKTYLARVRDNATGNMCWGNVKAEDKIPPKLNCDALTTVNLGAGGSVALPIASVQATAVDGCGASTLTYSGNQTSKSFNCQNLGMNTLTLEATDLYGNKGTCQTIILVEDPLDACPSCLHCPPAQFVTFQDAVTNLLPAYNSGNFAPFEAYGYAEFAAPFCTEDTLYNVSYSPSSAGQSWFAREFTALLGGLPVTSCYQPVIFPSTQTHTIGGKVFIDEDADCQLDPTETGVKVFQVLIKVLPGNQSYFIVPNADGTWSQNVPVDPSDDQIEVSLLLPNGMWTSCQNLFTIDALGAQLTHTANFGLLADLDCPLTKVNISEGLLRRCFNNNKYYVNYCNLGYLPAPAAQITVQFDPLVTVETADLPYTTGPGNTYIFNLGDIPPFTCNTFKITTKISCDAVIGQTLCATATITPHQDCNQSSWQGAFIEVDARCDGDNLHFILTNTGTQNMSETLEYIVVEDIILRQKGSFQLDAGKSSEMTFPANGATWRIEAKQVTGYPDKDVPVLSFEGCGGLNTPGLVNAFFQNDDPIYQDVSCAEVVGSYDPNDKAAVPSGYSADHYIPENTDIEYKIRFQNTGNDTAFTVIIADTLSEYLNPASFEAGVASHNYRIENYGNGIIRFVFKNIMLPDSNVNEPASHGFVTFRVAQKPDLPKGTRIENSAAIYFDFNDPIITNTVFQTVGAPYVSGVRFIDDQTRITAKPNPFTQETWLELEGRDLKSGTLRVYNARGEWIQTLEFTGNKVQLRRNAMPAGQYFFQVFEQGKMIGNGKLQSF